MEQNSCKLIAEVGATHIGSLERAINLIKLASSNGADVVKFQKRDPVSSVPKEIADKPHPNPHFAYGKTYLEHRLALELSINDHIILKEECKKNNVDYSCSVWDLQSAEQIVSIDPLFIKIPSACNKHENLINFCLKNFSKQIHISLGMLNLDERSYITEKFNDDRVVFYHTTSEYPCPFDRLYLKEIQKIFNKCGKAGFSNHGYGIAADIAAIALGASFVERHFIDDRTFRHTDAAASLEPGGLRTLKRDIVNVSMALKYKTFECTEEENIQSFKLRNHKY